MCPLSASLCRDRSSWRGRLWPVWVAPRCVTVPRRGVRVHSSRGRAFCSRDPVLGASPAQVCVLACTRPRVAPGSCRMYDSPLCAFSFASVRERSCTLHPLCFVCLTSAPPAFVRMAVESGGGGLLPRKGPGKGNAPPSLLLEASSRPQRWWEEGRRQRVWPAAL